MSCRLVSTLSVAATRSSMVHTSIIHMIRSAPGIRRPMKRGRCEIQGSTICLCFANAVTLVQPAAKIRSRFH